MISNATNHTSHPPLPALPEPPIFDPPYDARLTAILDGSAFPPLMSPDQIYQAQLAIINSILDELSSSSRNLSLCLLFAWLLMIILGGYLVVRVRRYRELSLSGDAQAARKIVLPAFEPLLWLLVVTNALFTGIYGILLVSTEVLAHKNKLTIEIIVALKMFNPLLVPIFMLQPSLSVRALIRATFLAIALSSYTVPVVILLNEIQTSENARTCFWVLASMRILLAVIMTVYLVFPPARASTRTFRLSCFYIILMTLLILAMAITFHHNLLDASKAIGWVIAVYAMFLPVVVWWLLRADTEHWRGIGKRAVELQEMFRRTKGKVDERVSSQGFHVLIEMHRKFIIDFVRLELRGSIAGSNANGSSTIYEGYLHPKKVPVAVKIYMPTNLTEDTVAEYSHEAALCGSLVHPNIAKFHGLCVCPPNICLVTELCQGSLQNIIDAQAAFVRRGYKTRLYRQQNLINIGYLMDAVRAIAYMHSFSPPFEHRDIKPRSFSVSDEGSVKLTDFGTSRAFSVHQGFKPRSAGEPIAKVAGRKARDASLPRSWYDAPEIIDSNYEGSARYGEAADVYSLAMVMWEVVHPESRHFFEVTPDRDLVHRIHGGERPPISHELLPSLQELIQCAWHGDPRRRPTSQAVVTALEAIQEELCAPFAATLMDEMHGRSRLVSTVKTSDVWNRFTGIQAIEKLRDRGFVSSQSEATRLGNMLMDSDFLHHAKHSNCFEYSSSQFFLDEDHIAMRQPLVVMDMEADEADRTFRGENLVVLAAGPMQLPHVVSSSSYSASVSSVGTTKGDRLPTAGRSSHVLMEKQCSCRQLGQRITTASASRRKFRRKFKVFTAENLLTARLLADDHAPTDFAAFGEPAARPARTFVAAAAEMA